jgi:hypothetical protein
VARTSEFQEKGTALPLAKTKKERSMRFNIVGRILASLPFAVMVFGISGTARAGVSCSTAKAAGNWGATLTGTLVLPTGPVPFAAVVRAAFNAQGNITQATEARNLGGDFANESITGAWTVSADCTGTLKINAYESGTLVRTSVLAIVFDQNMGQVRMVQESLVLPDGTSLPVVATLEGKRVFPSIFTFRDGE